MFSKILVANRGEIAIRVIRACKEMGISTVAVYSEADRDSLHVSLADEAVCVGGALAAESYLNQQNIIMAAIGTHAQAIHPGYGFLSENPEFARLCRDNGITFIGPAPEVIAKLGDKDAARKLMKEAGVPTVPGTDLISSVEEARREAYRIGYPILIKARAGGGGKGIRQVSHPDQLETAFHTASSEALHAFGDGSCYMERYLTHVKHVEIQLLADETGHVVCLGERECSIQRNNQKLLEEAPSPALNPALRERMSEAAIRAARAAGYTNAGTVEFLLDENKDFYFMEMNTRLQVEHAVTEQITGIDIVKWQIRIAAGVPLDFTREDVTLKGAAIECRINANGCGQVEFLHVPGGPWVRFDSALYQGDSISPYYDSMVGKLIVGAGTRAEAIRKMQSALCELVVYGVPNNIDQQIEILDDPAFQAGNYDTGFMLKHSQGLK